MGRPVFSQQPLDPPRRATMAPADSAAAAMLDLTPDAATPARGIPTRVNSDALSRLLFPDHREFRAQVLDVIKEPLFQRQFDVTVAQHRALTLARIRRLHAAGVFAGTLTPGDSAGSRRYDVVIDVLAVLDHSLEVLLGVDFGLFAASVRALGTPQQAAYWLPRIENFQDFGCFALTELGHGSNVRGIETLADYHADTQTFTLTTPTDTAQKYWIGGAADNATFAVVFAQLVIRGQRFGVNPFIVRLRDSDGRVVPRVRVADCGKKAGLNGVDNGRIWFDGVSVPRDAMLTRLSHVEPGGTFVTSIPSPDARFAAMLSALSGGRVGIAFNAIQVSLLGLTIAIRYCKQRRAFAPRPDAEEVPLLHYSSHKRLLMQPLAEAFVYFFCARDLREDWYDCIDSLTVSKGVHLDSAGFKAMFSWFMQTTLQTAREACGGQGYKSENIICENKADRDVMTTFEGANGVLMQQIGKQLVAECAKATKNGGRFANEGLLAPLNDVRASNTAVPVRDGTTEYFMRALLARENGLVDELWRIYTAASRKHKGNAFEAWNSCLPYAEKAAFAHMHRIIFTKHQTHIAKAAGEDVSCGQALVLCGRLWMTGIIASDVDMLRLGCVRPEDVSRAQVAIDELCDRVAGIADDLLTGVGFPDHLLAPIAGDFVRHNARPKL